MGSYVLDLEEIDRSQIAVAGGKGAHLGELARLEGIRVPAGFCVTTDAFGRIMAAAAPAVDDLLDRLGRLDPDDREAIRTLGAEVRRTVEEVAIPDDLAAAITDGLVQLGGPGEPGGKGEVGAYAVRSSATAEDLPGASFAGQQDTYLNVVGPAAVLDHVRRCWASLFTDRAVAYRLRNGFDHREVHMAVVVQRMVVPQAAGVLFTADPVTGNRRVASVEAVFGLGEALVSGLANADVYRVRDDEIVAKTIATKERALVASSPAGRGGADRGEGGTQERPVEPARRDQAALTDAQVVELVRLGRRIEAHFGRPQDVEWCLAGDGGFWIVQARPITTLFPRPEVDDGENHVYVSVGHQQMMTDPMKPLGLSIWQMTTPATMAEVGGRLFVDVTKPLSSPASRAGLVGALGKSDPLIGDALRTIVERDDGFLPSVADDGPAWTPPGTDPANPIATDPAIVTELIEQTEASIAAARRAIAPLSGTALLDVIPADIQEMRRVQFDPRSMQVVMAGMEATWWLNDHLLEWLGEKNAADTLTQSVPHNVTAEMGLALLDVADVIRPHPEVVAFLRRVEDEGRHEDQDGDGFLDELAGLDGGAEAAQAIRAFLDRYGMRCVGEIDITRPRWSERPSTLVPVLLGNVENFAPGAGPRRFEQGRQEALAKRDDVLTRLRALPDGDRKADETERVIERARTFNGYREHPKYGMICRYFVYKQALLGEAERLVQAGVLHERDDIFFLRFEELQEVVRTQQVDDGLVARRKGAFRSYAALTPPRVLTSDGEAVAGAYRRDDLPDGALVGLPVSAGTVEGRARVVLDMADADLARGDILVTAYTDPSWSPLFVTAAGLVTEVGGLMTHGAVVAREYGLPAVVGVEHATRLIRDGRRIRVNGSDGYVELL
jgi:pyruvate,water dikinase